MSEFGKKYSWLKSRNLFTGKIDSEFDAMDSMPEGWRAAFGNFLCEELDAALKKAGLEEKFEICDVKEKYGGLRFYVSNSNTEIDDIILKYEILSENICVDCGKPDVPMLHMSWISPYCEDCYRKIQKEKSKFGVTSKDYNEIADTNHSMSDILKYSIYSNGEERILEIDISETVTKIREQWLSRH